MLINRINPVLLQLGVVEIRYYGLIYALGFVLAYLFLKKWSREGRLSLDEKQLDSLLMHLLIGVVVGARLLEAVFYRPWLFWTDPLEILKVWHGGLSFHGGLVGAVIGVWRFSRKEKKGLMPLFDALVIPATLALALGRIANFTNHELYGPPASVAWCVVFLAVDRVCRHPYQLYASLSHFALFFFLFWLYGRHPKEGVTFWSFVLGYGILRVLTDFWKVEARFFGLGTGQWLSILMVAAGGVMLWKLTKASQAAPAKK